MEFVLNKAEAELYTIQDWLADTQAALNLLSHMDWSDFVKRYNLVLRAAVEQLSSINDRLAALVRNSARLKPGEFLVRYVEAMSVRTQDHKIFLPSFSDECLWEVVKGSSIDLSPFRGLYYAWKLGEIAYLFQQSRKMGSAFKMLDKLLVDRLERDYARQSSLSSGYREYEEALRGSPSNPVWIKQIEQAKIAFREVTVPRKWKWIHLLPYPCRTQIHFYLSGIRFYHNAHLGDPKTLDFEVNDRYCVNSADSGLVVPEERYGMLLPAGADKDMANELITEIPPGSLLLDLSNQNATEEDCQALKYFENWSRLITAKAYAIATETLSLHSYARRRGNLHRASLYEKLARGTYLDALSKNPMRTFYFDTGIYGAARLAARLGFPKVQYVTTRRTRVGRSKGDPGRHMLDTLFTSFGDGIEFYLTKGVEWPERTMATWTLTPSGRQLPHRTSCLWSIRGSQNRKIVRGMEGLKRHVYAQRVIEPAELVTEGVEALVGAAVGGALVPEQILLGIVSGGLLGAARSGLKVHQDVARVLREIDGVRASDEYQRIRETSEFPTVQR